MAEHVFPDVNTACGLRVVRTWDRRTGTCTEIPEIGGSWIWERPMLRCGEWEKTDCLLPARWVA